MILRPPVYCDAPSNIWKYNTACQNDSGTLILSCFTAPIRDLLQSTCLGMHHHCIIGEFRHLGLARGTNILRQCLSLDFLCILEERLKILPCCKWGG